MVPIYDQMIAMNDRRSCFAPTVASSHVSQVALPDLLSIKIETENPSRTKRNVKPLAVGCRRRRSKRVRWMSPFVRSCLTCHAPPNLVARIAIQTNDSVLKDVWRRYCFREVVRHRRFLRDAIHFDRGDNEQPVLPDNRCRTPFAGNRHLPFDVRVRIPLNWRIGVRGHSASRRSPPLVPIVLATRFKIA